MKKSTKCYYTRLLHTNGSTVVPFLCTMPKMQGKRTWQRYDKNELSKTCMFRLRYTFIDFRGGEVK